jgi:AcrR family transcriptional regulator
MPPAGLRDRKKAQTRQAIIDAAERLFAERGFEAVTVEEIAGAAHVTKKTVFNHFQSKEDLALDRAGQYEQVLLAVIRDRPEGTSALDAFRALCRRQGSELQGIRGHLRRGGDIFSLIDSSSALQQRMAGHRQRAVASVTAELRRESGTGPGDPWPEVLAWTLVGTTAIMFGRLRELAAGPTTLQRAAALYASEVDQVFDHLGGIDDPGRARGTPGTRYPNPADPHHPV